MTKEKFDFHAGIKKKVLIIGVLGLLLFALGGVLSSTGGHGEEHGDATHTEQGHDGGGDHAAEGGEEGAGHGGALAMESGGGEDAGAEHEKGWWDRVIVDLWINNVYFTGLALIGIFFFAIQYASQAGWSTTVLRIPLSMAHWTPIAGVLMLVTFLAFNHNIFHWTHSDLYEVGGAHFDSIIDGKKSYFFMPGGEGGGFPIFYVLRMVVFFGLWIWLFTKMRNLAYAEDELGGTTYWYKIRKWSAIFLGVFAVSSSISAWDWVMSIDTHWFSTMFGWYVFASWWVSGLALITLIVVLLKEAGYLSQVTIDHLHDLGKFVFAFSIFWTYIWFSQFLLIYYANIPEESVYFIERLKSDHYSPYFFVNLIMNFFFPFLCLMTRDAKRLFVFLKIACIVVIAGHWLDFYLMATPGTLGESGGFGLTEIGMYMFFGAAFIYVTLNALSKQALVAKNHPMLEEAKHHHI
ncbi:MAG: hypothetical protein Roseis2KO_17750 [Roseivirga sp.]